MRPVPETGWSAKREILGWKRTAFQPPRGWREGCCQQTQRSEWWPEGRSHAELGPGHVEEERVLGHSSGPGMILVKMTSGERSGCKADAMD